VVIGAGNVACAARSGADLIDGFVHGLQHDRVLALAEIVVRAPDHHLALALAVGIGPDGAGELAANALEVGEYAIAAFGFHLIDGCAEGALVIELVGTMPSNR